MERKMKVNEDFSIENMRGISIDGMEISFKGLNALFLTEDTDYTYVKTKDDTFSVCLVTDLKGDIDG